MVNPQIGEKVLDLAAGTGGFLTATIEHLRKENTNIETLKAIQENVIGWEYKPLPFLLATTNLIVHDVEVPNITFRDALDQPLSNYTERDRVNVILANPPFGGIVANNNETNFPQNYRTRESADLFLILMIHLLKMGGRAGIVLPDGSLTGEGVKQRVRERLLTECNLHTIIRLPNSVFQPYATVATNLLFFDKGTTPFVFTVSKNGGTGFATAVQYQTFDGTATVANNDYQAQSGTLNFGPNETAKQITVLVNGDTVIEPNETFFVRLSNNPVNALIGDGEGQGTILNDDPGATPTPTPTPPNRFEGDINRTASGVPGTGDGDVNVGDQIQYQRFLNGSDCPSASEQVRLDAGPRATLGDGLLGAADGTAIDAYARHDASTDFDPNTPGWQPTPAGGPTAITNLGCTPPAEPEGDETSALTKALPEAEAARIVRLIPAQTRRNNYVTVDIEMAAQGNEAGTQFGLHFDPTVLAISDISGVNVNPDISLGANTPEGTTLNVNAEDAANGNIGIVENFNGASPTITAIPQGATRIARVRFRVLDTATAGESKIIFDESVIRSYTADVTGRSLTATYDQEGAVTVSATPGVRVSGKVTTPDGRGLRNATVTIVDQSGFARTVTTSAFGYYTFDGVAEGERYTIATASHQYRFGSRTLEINDNLADLDFAGSE